MVRFLDISQSGRLRVRLENHIGLLPQCEAIEKNLLVYCGHLVYNRHNKKVDGKYVGGQKYRPEEEGEIYRDAHSPAITEKQAEAFKAQHRKKSFQKPKPRNYLLTGQLYCGICKGPMVGDSGYYICSHKRKRIADCTNSNISSDFLDKTTISFVKESLLTQTHFENVIEETRKAYREELQENQRDNSRSKARINEN